jgi:8-oxo-dGTP pyrophosphatase MutT (NUDIX family)
MSNNVRQKKLPASLEMGIDTIGVSIVFFCHDGHGHFVMDKRGPRCRDEQGRWEIGGGALEIGDTVLSRLRTEVKEEYGCDILSHTFLGYRDVHRVQKGKKTHWITLDFSVVIDPVQVKNGEPEKFDDVRLFDFDALPEPTHSQFPHFMKAYHSRLFTNKE